MHVALPIIRRLIDDAQQSRTQTAGDIPDQSVAKHEPRTADLRDTALIASGFDELVSKGPIGLVKTASWLPGIWTNRNCPSRLDIRGCPAPNLRVASPCRQYRQGKLRGVSGKWNFLHIQLLGPMARKGLSRKLVVGTLHKIGPRQSLMKTSRHISKGIMKVLSLESARHLRE